MVLENPKTWEKLDVRIGCNVRIIDPLFQNLPLLPRTELNRVGRSLIKEQWSGFRTIQQTDFQR